jgi:steroid 5-alpha reductase family enzyme
MRLRLIHQGECIHPVRHQLKAQPLTHKQSPSPLYFRFFSVWCIQSFWVILTALPVFIINASPQKGLVDSKPLDIGSFIGLGIFVVGFGFEVVADSQKKKWAAVEENKIKFIDVGLWYYSRHPNYFGEITLWMGNFIAASSVLVGSEWICALSPVFVYCLLMFVSGVPGMEVKSDTKFKGQADYDEYMKSTNVLVPWFKASKKKAE